MFFLFFVGQRLKEPKTSDSCIKNRCNIDAAMSFFHNDVLPNLTPIHKALLAETPFIHLFAFPVSSHANNPALNCMLLYWEDKKGAFVVSGKDLKFTEEEVGLVMGLAVEGEVVQYTRGGDNGNSLRNRHFSPKGKISVPQLENAIRNALTKQSAEEDVVGLLVMYLFTMILFPLASGLVPAHLFHYAEDFRNLRNYNWAQAVHRVLIVNIPNNAAWCRLRRDNKTGSLDEEQDDGEKKKKESGTLPGCALALIVSFKNMKPLF
jgi:hypothetical protein